MNTTRTLKNSEKTDKETVKELQQKILNNYIVFFVLLAFSIGMAITFIALGVYGNEPKLMNFLPLIIIALCVFPIYNVLRKANNQKRELKNRKLG